MLMLSLQNAAPEFLRMTIMESQDAKHARGMHFEQRLNHCMALIRQAGELREGGAITSSLCTYLH